MGELGNNVRIQLKFELFSLLGESKVSTFLSYCCVVDSFSLLMFCN